MDFNSTIFKAYDVRGIYPQDFNEKAAYNIGRSFVVLTKAKNIIVGHDMRLSSPKIASALIKGLIDQGSSVIDIGMVGTDQFYFVMGEYGYDGGFMVTASHNPASYNGLKIMRKGNNFIASGSGMEELKNLAIKDDFPKSDKTGEVLKKNFQDKFIKKLLSFINPDKIKPFKIVIDASSGMAGPILIEIFKHLPCKIIPLYFEPNGSFPGHEPDPMSEENRKDLKNKILKEKADFGFIFDGDADRFIMVDDKGEFIFPDYIISIIAKYILQKNPRAAIISDATCSWVIKDTIKKYNGKLIIERTGHSFIKKRMKKEGALFAGETSGHFYFKDFYGCDTGLLPALLLLQIISQTSESFLEIIKRYRQEYFLTGIINFKVSNKEKMMGKIENIYKNQGAKISHLDGVSVEFSNWRFILRPSNTEPLLRLILEAKTKNLKEEKTKEIINLLKQ